MRATEQEHREFLEAKRRHAMRVREQGGALQGRAVALPTSPAAYAELLGSHVVAVHVHGKRIVRGQWAAYARASRLMPTTVLDVRPAIRAARELERQMNAPATPAATGNDAPAGAEGTTRT